MADQHFYFDIWPANDPTGTALGELTDAFDKTTKDADQAIGSGSFRINRHSAQAAWCSQRAIVRVRLATGGPWAYNDPRYVFAFFIESSQDVALSPDEEGGENLTRGGRSVVAYLERAIIYPNANISGHASYWSQAKVTGEVIIPNRTVGEAFRILILNALQRAGNIEGLTIDFTITDDSASVAWPDTDTDWKFPVGMNLLDVLSKLHSSQTYFRMRPSLLLSCYEDHPGTNLAGSITFQKGVELSEASEKAIQSQGFMSRALVKGTKKDNELQFVQVFNTTVEAETGRFEGFVEYQSTPTTGRLTRAGNQAIARAKLQHDGPTTAGVYSTTAKPYEDYLPGDTVGLNIPDVYDSAEVRVAAIVLNETEGGEYDVIVEFEDSPFDPMSGPDNFSSVDDRTTGNPPGGGSRGCGDCPESTPFVPPPDSNVVDVVLTIGSGVFVNGGGPDVQEARASDLGVAPVELIVGQQYRLVVQIVSNLNTGSPTTPDTMSSTAVGIKDPTRGDASVTQAGIAGVDWVPDDVASTTMYLGDGLGWSWKDPIASGGTAPNGSYDAGQVIEGDWLLLNAAPGGGPLMADVNWGGVALSGYYGYHNVARVILQTRNGDGSPIESELPTAPRQGQVVGETATDPAVAGVYTTNFPYIAGSLRVWVSGVQVAATEVTPASGTWQFPDGFDPGSGTISVQYQALNSTPTGSTNGPWAPTSSVIPPSLLPVLEDDKWKQPARVATTGNVTISTALNVGDSIDGVTLVEGDRVLVRAQSTGSQNGVYIAGATPVRATDFDDDDEVLGALVHVVAGSTLAGKVYRVTNTTVPDVGTDTITFAELTGGSGIAATIIDAKGDLIVGTAADTPGILGAPSFDGSTLIRDAGQTTGLAWQSNRVTTTSPTVTDDGAGGWRVGSRWVNTTTDVEYVLLDASTGAAVWVATTGAGATDLDDLTDVVITSPASGDVLIYNGSQWENDTAGSASALDDLTDVDTSGVGSGDVLTYDGADWVAQAPTGGSGLYSPWDVPSSANGFDREGTDSGVLTGATDRASVSSAVADDLISVTKSGATGDRLAGTDWAETMGTNGDHITVGLRDGLLWQDFQALGLYLCDSTFTAALSLALVHDSSAGAYIQRKTWTNTGTGGGSAANYTNPGMHGLPIPMFLRIQRDTGTTDYSVWASWGGRRWFRLANALNPGFTVARAGIAAYSASNTVDVAADVGFLRKNWSWGN
jgi:hypothetical protein